MGMVCAIIDLLPLYAHLWLALHECTLDILCLFGGEEQQAVGVDTDLDLVAAVLSATAMGQQLCASLSSQQHEALVCSPHVFDQLNVSGEPVRIRLRIGDGLVGPDERDNLLPWLPAGLLVGRCSEQLCSIGRFHAPVTMFFAKNCCWQAIDIAHEMRHEGAF